MTTAFTLNVILSTFKGHPGDLTYSGIINFGHFPTESEHSYQWFEVPIFMALGIIGEPCVPLSTMHSPTHSTPRWWCTLGLLTLTRSTC